MINDASPFGGVYIGQQHVILRTDSQKRRDSTKRRSDPLRASLRRLRAKATPAAETPSWGGVYLGPGRVAQEMADSPMPKSGKVKCQVCGKKCAGDILKADDKYFHIACFACATCHRPLSEVGYFVHEGKYYCPSDYHAQFGARCTVCGDFVEGNVVQCLGKSFHQRCFRCDRCKQPFPKDQKVTWTGKEHLCKRCVTVPVATVKPTQQPTPSVIHSSIDKPGSPPPTNIPTACQECKQIIHSGQVLLALGGHFHIWCFKCTTCGSVLHGEYLAKDGLPYCIRDYNQAFGVPCHECDKYITGKVLQAGGFQFHPTCATCSRCAQHFGDGQEMCMQGDEIWHPGCNDVKPTEKVMHSHNTTRSPRSSYGGPKYSTDFGRHLTYMYLLPDIDMGYLKHPISPHPTQSQQFHTPQGPVKIRKSRCSILKTGMQKFVESLEDDRPRPKSPHMDNEEPIELSHYPGASVPDPDKMPAIEREDFPAPPYPYAIEELRRRLSHSDLDDEADDDEIDGQPEVDKLEKAEEELKKIDHDSSLVHVFVQNLEERQKKVKLPLHWDPRSAARTPSAKKLPHLRCRYESPINASPSRYENRPKPWMFWEDRAATTQIPFGGGGTHQGYSLPGGKSNTMPGGNAYFGGEYSAMNTTRSSMYSDSTMISAAGTLPPSGVQTFQPNHHLAMTTIRQSLPDMSKPPVIFKYNDLITANKKLPEDIDRCHMERHLSKDEFEKLFHMTPLEFYKLPEWKRINLKRKAKLF